MYTVRKAKPGDEKEIAKIHVNSWISTYTGLIPESFLNSLSVEKRTLMWAESIKQMYETPHQLIVFICEDHLGKPVGFIAGGAERVANSGYDGELYALYLYQDLKGKGLGRRLISELSRWLIQSAYKKMRVWVLESNPSCGFYEKMGGKILSSKKKLEFDGKESTAIAYGWDNLTELSMFSKI